MTNALTKYISDELLGTRVKTAVSADDDLLTSGLLDSLGIMRLVWFIEQEFVVEVPAEDVTIENFQTVSKIVAYLERRSGKGSEVG